MHVKIEPSGCLVTPDQTARREREGCWVGVMCRFYLDPGDPGYDDYYATHHVWIPKVTAEYDQWVRSLPKDENGVTIMPNPNDPYEGYPGEMMWQLNPFHNHRIYVEPDAQDKDILDMAQGLLKLSAEKYAKKEDHRVANKPLMPVAFTAKRLSDCEAKVADIKSKQLERKASKTKAK